MKFGSAARVLGLFAALLVFAGAGAGTYTLKPGDTLAEVARRFGVSVKSLAEANDIENPSRVREGRKVTIPQLAATAHANGSTTKRYVVVNGDTLAGIASTHGTTSSQLRRLNDLPPGHVLRAGTSLRVPVRAGDPPSKASGAACPVQGARQWDISDGWGSPRSGGRSHKGNDIFARRGTKVVAPVSGTIEDASGASAGLAFHLRGDDGVTYYGAHLGSLAMRGGRVERGAVIGTVGNSGNAKGTPPHLHFEIQRDGRPIDPNATLKRWC